MKASHPYAMQKDLSSVGAWRLSGLLDSSAREGQRQQADMRLICETVLALCRMGFGRLRCMPRRAASGKGFRCCIAVCRDTNVAAIASWEPILVVPRERLVGAACARLASSFVSGTCS